MRSGPIYRHRNTNIEISSSFRFRFIRRQCFKAIPISIQTENMLPITTHACSLHLYSLSEPTQWTCTYVNRLVGADWLSYANWNISVWYCISWYRWQTIYITCAPAMTCCANNNDFYYGFCLCLCFGNRIHTHQSASYSYGGISLSTSIVYL